MSNYREIARLLRANATAHHRRVVFEDFVEMAALALRNAVDIHDRDSREQRYLNIINRYSKTEAERFPHVLALIVDQMDRAPGDVLGHLYMEMELGKDGLGQFFTPFDLALLIAATTVDDLSDQIRDHGFARLYEPACGAGSLIIAASQQLRQRGLNPQTQLHVTAADLSSVAVHMSYIHLSLLHIPAVIYHRDTLSQETFGHWPTPAHVLRGWPMPK